MKGENPDLEAENPDLEAESENPDLEAENPEMRMEFFKGENPEMRMDVIPDAQRWSEDEDDEAFIPPPGAQTTHKHMERKTTNGKRVASKNIHLLSVLPYFLI